MTENLDSYLRSAEFFVYLSFCYFPSSGCQSSGSGPASVAQIIVIGTSQAEADGLLQVLDPAEWDRIAASYDGTKFSNP
jgi:hypothetical protein